MTSMERAAGALSANVVKITEALRVAAVPQARAMSATLADATGLFSAKVRIQPQAAMVTTVAG